MSSSPLPSSSVVPPSSAPAPPASTLASSSPLPTTSATPDNGAGGSSGSGENLGPGGPGAGAGVPPQQQPHCPLPPVTPVTPSRLTNGQVAAVDSLLSVAIQANAKLPWNQEVTARTSFKLTGCITQLTPVRRNGNSSANGHVDWWCPARQSQEPSLKPGFTLAWTHYATSNQPEAPSPPPFSYRHVRFDPPPGTTLASSPVCTFPDGPPLVPQVSTDMFHKECATCPPGKPMVNTTFIPDSRQWHLHGCIEAEEEQFCSWFQFPMNMTCFGADKVSRLVPFTITCKGENKSRTDKVVVPALLNEGVLGAETGLGSGGVGSNGENPSGSGRGAIADEATGKGMSTMALTALIVVPIIGIAFLAAAAVIYRRRQARFSRQLSDSQSPMRLRRASVTCMPASSVSHTEMSPVPASPQTATTLVKMPAHVFPNVTLHPLPRAPTSTAVPTSPSSMDRDVSLQSLTDAWNAQFLSLEHSATTHARTELPTNVPVARVRACRAEYMAAVMVHVWQVLRGHEHVPANASVGELADAMRNVLVRTGKVYPGFKLAWPEVGAEWRDEVASVYFERESESGVQVARVVRAVVFPGWVDQDRGVVVVKARVVV
ncbi:hypothetical protein BCR44DRAFT_78096 [Catenaria anguillulae PL171]|uniref:Uncharacterized protein n=1 Tax=Catenaria anguillulae PL171 TaxID=765915 RepID=A0A1Y2H9W4_9FUNG|nr:hypothetical protein BCR44DRAFT_78096 [Catenaria anguillulae PL171]